MKTLQLLIAALFLVSIGAVSLEAQQIVGRVMTTDGIPLVGANCWLMYEQTGTQTDTAGYFQLDFIGPDTLQVSYLGFATIGIPIMRDTSLQVVELAEKQATTAMIEVRAERRPAKVFALARLNRLDVYLNPAAKADVLLAVNSLPAATNPDETANVSLRGSPSAATSIFLNQVPLYDAVRLDQPNGVGQFSIFNTGIIQGLDVYASNPPLYLGQSSAGAVSMRTSSTLTGENTTINLHLAGGGVQVQRALGANTGVVAYSNYSNHASLKATNAKALRNIDNFSSGDLGMFVAHKFSERTYLNVFNLTILERYGYRISTGRFRGLFEQQKDRNLSVVNLVHQTPKGRLEWNQGFNTSKANYALGNILTTVQLFDYHTNLQWQWQKRAWNGTAALHYTVRSSKTAGTYPLYAGALELTDPFASYEQDLSWQTPEAALFAKRSLGAKGVFGVGTRIGHDQSEQWLWGAQANYWYQLTARQQLTIAAGRYYLQTSPRSIAAAPWYNYAYQIAAEWSFEPQYWAFNFSTYRHWNNWEGQENPIYGAEATVKYETYPLTAWVSATHVRSQLLAQEQRYPSRYDFAYLLRIGARAQLPIDITLTINGLWRQGQYYVPLQGRAWEDEIAAYIPVMASATDGIRLPQYRRFDLGLSRPFFIGEGLLIVFFNVNNVFDHDNVQSYVYDEAFLQRTANLYSGRTWFIGATWQW